MVRNIDPSRLASTRAAYTRPDVSKPQAQPSAVESTTPFKTLMQQQTAEPASAQSSAPSLKTIAALPNGGLMLNPSGSNALTGGNIPYNPNYYATPEAATALAQQLGGVVVDQSSQFSNNQAQYYIALPNGTTINAGNLMAILNNPVYQENSRVMDGKVAELLNNNAVGTPGAGVGLYSVTNGRVTYDASLNPTVYAT